MDKPGRKSERSNLQAKWQALSLGVLITLVAAGANHLRAQESTSYQVREHQFSGAGTSADAPDLASATFLSRPLGAGSVGDLDEKESASFILSAGPEEAYLPPGEISGLMFLSPENLIWDPEPSAGLYHVYRGQVADLASSGTGTCHAASLTSPNATDASAPDAGAAYFYLVTVENRLGQEGTKGSGFVGGIPSPRTNPAPCP